MGELTTYRLADVCDFINGFAFKSTDYVPRSRDTIEVLRMGYINRGGGFKEDNTPVFIPKGYKKNLDRYLLMEGDIVIAMTDMKNNVAILANTARIKETNRFVLNQRAGCIRINNVDLLDPIFFYYYTNWLPHVEYLRSRANSGVQVNLSTSAIKEAEIYVPSISVQRLIGSLLSALDDKIELNRRMNETLEGMARAIFKDWFIDFGPTRAKMAGTKPYLAPEIWKLFPDKLDDKEKPEGWEMGTLADIAKTNAESWTARNHPDTVEYVDLSNTKWGIIESTALLKWDKAPSRARRIAKNGDTIVGTTRPGNGSFAYISKDGYTASTGFAVLSPRKAIYRDLVYITATNSENIKRLANLADGHGGAYPAVKPDVVSATKLVLVGDKIITAFAKITSELRNKIEQSKAESRTLAQTRDLLLPKLMSGEIRVRDAEKQIGEVI